jgi:hypothetical protein
MIKRKITRPCPDCEGRLTLTWKDCNINYGTTKNPKYKKQSIWTCNKCGNCFTVPREYKYTIKEKKK